MDTYRINEYVTLQEGVTRRGSLEKLHCPSVNEDLSKNPHVSRAFRIGFRGFAVILMYHVLVTMEM